MSTDRTEKALELFDGYNKQDPNLIIWDGTQYPAEYFYALQLYEWVKKLEPRAREDLLLASRCQHIGRWKIPRNQYPSGKAGYYKWRNGLAKFHAETAGRLLAEAGYHEEEIKAVQHILLKENLRKDEVVQTMENALCLVFLQFQYEDFITKHDDQMVIRILKKTWTKMTGPGTEAALSLDFGEKGKALLIMALGDNATGTINP
ncbi:MAG: DUF4202 domain-containing protein [Flavisolibacter sp.]